MKIFTLLTLLTILLNSSLTAQTTIDFDDDTKWIAGSGSVGSYQPDHQYVDGDFSAVGGDGLRQGSADQGGVPGAIGTYSWRLRNDQAVVWTATIATGGISTFSLDARAWDNSPSPDYKIEVSTDMGATWDSITTINNVTLSNSVDWTTFNGTVNSANNDILIKLIPNGNTERIMIDNFSWIPYGVIADTAVSISTADLSVVENVGSIDVTVELNQAAALTKTVDLVLLSGNPAVVNSFSSETVTFLPGSTSETVTVDIISGQLGSASDTFDFALSNPSGVTFGIDTDFELTVYQLPVNPSACSDLFFSEYIESSGNKAIEIYNPTTSAIDLSNYQIRLYSNGATSPSTNLSLLGNLIPGDVYVIANSSANPSILAETDLTSAIANFNGDDALELFNISLGVAVDIIGEIANDPGSSWPVGTGSTEDVTMVRMNTVTNGNLLWPGGSDQEWDVYGLNEYTYIGEHSTTGCSGPANPVAFPTGQLSICIGDTIMLTHNSFGGTAPYLADWAVSGIPISSGDTLLYEATVAGTLPITLIITDDNSITDDSTFNVIVRSNPVGGFILSEDSICAGDTSIITSTGPGPGIYSYSYDMSPSGAIINAGGPVGNGYFTSNTSNTYEIIQTLTDAYGCYDTSILNISVLPLEDASFTASDICDDEILTLTHPDNSGTWSGTGVTDGGSGIGDFASTTAGDYYITYTTGGTCPDTYTDTLEVFASPAAGFTFTGSITVDFTDASTGTISSYSWDFGDGNTSTQTSPSHTYTTDGNYIVCLVVESTEGCNDTICQDVTIAGIGINEMSASGISFYPNPASDLITIDTDESVVLSIFDVIGKLMIQQRIDANSTISVENLVPGSYFIQFEQNGEKYTEKLIIR